MGSSPSTNRSKNTNGSSGGPLTFDSQVKKAAAAAAAAFKCKEEWLDAINAAAAVIKSTNQPYMVCFRSTLDDYFNPSSASASGTALALSLPAVMIDIICGYSQPMMRYCIYPSGTRLNVYPATPDVLETYQDGDTSNRDDSRACLRGMQVIRQSPEINFTLEGSPDDFYDLYQSPGPLHLSHCTMVRLGGDPDIIGVILHTSRAGCYQRLIIYQYSVSRNWWLDSAQLGMYTKRNQDVINQVRAHQAGVYHHDCH